MVRYGEVGAFRQKHPRIRGDLNSGPARKPSKRQIRHDAREVVEEPYFVPSISIRRHLHRSEEELWNAGRKMLSGRLGRSFSTIPTQEVSLKIIEQHHFIKNMRAAGIRPEPEEVKDLAYSIRDSLTRMLANARSPLEVPLGNFGRFGYMNNAMAYELEGWRGERAPRAANDKEGFMDTFAVLLDERRLALGAIAHAFEGADLTTDGMAPSPHITVARSKDAIPDYRMHELRRELADISFSEVQLADPVISLKLYRDEPAIPIPIKHAWESLADVHNGFAPDPVETEPAFVERYESYADAF